jgi:NAD dependent epimerase/dehydratase family enzyme
MNFRILVGGVAWPIGTALLTSLRTNGCSFVRQVRVGKEKSPTKAEEKISSDSAAPLDALVVSAFDAVIHLCSGVAAAVLVPNPE